jgi:hypothetical protein
MQLTFIVINDPITLFEDEQRCLESIEVLDIEKEVIQFLLTDFENPAIMQNAGLAQAKYDLISFVNTGEFLSKEYGALLDPLKSSVVGATYSDFSIWYPKPNTNIRRYMQSYNRSALVGGEQLHLTGAIFKKQFADKFNEQLSILEDWSFWLNLSRKRSLYHIPESLRTIKYSDIHVDKEQLEK